MVINDAIGTSSRLMTEPVLVIRNEDAKLVIISIIITTVTIASGSVESVMAVLTTAEPIPVGRHCSWLRADHTFWVIIFYNYFFHSFLFNFFIFFKYLLIFMEPQA